MVRTPMIDNHALTNIPTLIVIGVARDADWYEITHYWYRTATERAGRSAWQIQGITVTDEPIAFSKSPMWISVVMLFHSQRKWTWFCCYQY